MVTCQLSMPRQVVQLPAAVLGGPLQGIQYDPLHETFLSPWRDYEAQQPPFQSFRLLDLPEELQMNILEYALGPWTAYGLDATSFESAEAEDHNAGFVMYGCPQPTTMNLLRTSRLVHDITLAALHNNFTGHLSMNTTPRKNDELCPHFSVTTTHPLSRLYRQVLDSVMILRITLPGKITSRIAAENASSRPQLVPGKDSYALPSLERIESDYSLITQEPLFVRFDWTSDDFKQFRLGEKDSVIVEDAMTLSRCILENMSDDGAISLLKNDRIPFCFTMLAAQRDEAHQYQTAFAKVQIHPSPGRVLVRAITNIDGRVEWQGGARDSAPLPKSLPGEAVTGNHVRELW